MDRTIRNEAQCCLREPFSEGTDAPRFARLKSVESRAGYDEREWRSCLRHLLDLFDSLRYGYLSQARVLAAEGLRMLVRAKILVVAVSSIASLYCTDGGKFMIRDSATRAQCLNKANGLMGELDRLTSSTTIGEGQLEELEAKVRLLESTIPYLGEATVSSMKNAFVALVALLSVLMAITLANCYRLVRKYRREWDGGPWGYTVYVHLVVVVALAIPIIFYSCEVASGL